MWAWRGIGNPKKLALPHDTMDAMDPRPRPFYLPDPEVPTWIPMRDPWDERYLYTDPWNP